MWFVSQEASSDSGSPSVRYSPRHPEFDDSINGSELGATDGVGIGVLYPSGVGDGVGVGVGVL